MLSVSGWKNNEFKVNLVWWECDCDNDDDDGALSQCFLKDLI